MNAPQSTAPEKGNWSEEFTEIGRKRHLDTSLIHTNMAFYIFYLGVKLCGLYSKTLFFSWISSISVIERDGEPQNEYHTTHTALYSSY